MRISDITEAKPLLLVDAGNAWDDLSGKFGGHAQDCGKYLQVQVFEKWQGGVGAESAADYLGRVRDDLNVARQEIESVGTVLRAAGEAIAALQGRMKNLIAEAKEAGFTVHDDGSVTGPDLSKKGLSSADLGAAERDQAERMKGFAEGIGTVLKDARAADKEYADALRTYTDAGRRCTKSNGTWFFGFLENYTARSADRDLLKEIGMPDKNGSPTAINSWWKGLPPELRAKLLEDHPYILGNRDGIPAGDRDKANRIYLPILIRKLEDEYQTASGSKKSELKDKIDGLQGIQKQIHDNRGDMRPYLLGIGEEGNGRAIVSFGNPDTAKNVSAYVPGLNTKLDAHFADSDVGRAFNVADRAAVIDPKNPTASIVWLGYDAPQMTGDHDPTDVMFSATAQRGAPIYDRFLQGIRATHEGDPPHVTALGHSYGSLAVGQASQQKGGLPADDVILVGSPGTGVDKASDLGVGSDHVYVGSAENDQVTHLPPSVGKLNRWIDLIAPGGEFSFAHQGAFGHDPASRDFGAHRFSVAPGEDTGITGLAKGNTPAHSIYFDQRGGDSLDNIAKIVTGHGDKISKAAPR
ncbi:alpha/beta hydrolase [Streptomyces sp. NPDC052396]|uniref:alpha/beta hydrolase n=1 Tax=Streptomyces sp. NPDC052396 TaxID=3365689 RepID=UPI0037D1F744